MWSNKAISVARDLGAEDLEWSPSVAEGRPAVDWAIPADSMTCELEPARSEELNARPTQVSATYINLGDWAWLASRDQGRPRSKTARLRLLVAQRHGR